MSMLSEYGGQMLRRKSVDALRAMALAETGGGARLKRSLGVTRLTMIGISSTIGTGIFFILGVATPLAGPAVVISFVIAGLAAALSALCYAELVSALPTAGSAYSAVYAALGEAPAFLVAACLFLEYGVSISAVSVTWGQYLNRLGDDLFGLHLPHVLSAAPAEGGLVNLPAVALVGLATLLLLRGARESATVNAIMVLLKVGVLIMFIVVGATAFNAGNFHPFMPHGISGIGAAAALIFFTYVGIDSVATAGEEAINPHRTLPLATMIAFIVVTCVYLGVAIVALGAQPAAEFGGQEAGLAVILYKVTQARWPSVILTAGAIISIFSIVLVLLYSQTRVAYAVSRDGLLPSLFSRVDPRTGVPSSNTITLAALAALLSGFLPLGMLAELVSVGTLSAFTMAALSVIVLRVRQPDLPRGFRTPLYPLTPLASMALCLYLLAGLAPLTWSLFGLWLVAAAMVYVFYSMRRSHLCPDCRTWEKPRPRAAPLG